MGDSAGAAIVVAVTIIAIQRGFRVPDGLVLPYPALTFTPTIFNPSMLLALDDPIISGMFLNFCLTSYLGKVGDVDHPYISSLKASDDIFKQFPRTRIMIPSNDPIRDDGFRLTY